MVAPQKMSVHLYKVHTEKGAAPLDDLLERIANDHLVDRLRRVGPALETRVEHVVKPKKGAPYWLLDFTRLRFEHGPGKASRTTPIQGFQLADGEGFGEETAVMYIPSSEYLLVQYNHFGVRSGSIETYFNGYDHHKPNGYTLLIEFDAETKAKLSRKNLFTRLEFQVAPAKISKEMKKLGIPLTRALEMGGDFHAETIQVSMSLGRSKNGTLNFDAVRSTVSALLRAAGNDAGVSKLQVSGKQDPDDRIEVLDLLAPRLRLDFEDIELGSDLRFTQQSRWRALQRARAAWKEYVGIN
jgi:hypothetical protein